MKKIISVLLVTAVLLTSMAVSAFAETTSGTCGENLTWTFNTSTGELTISGEGRMGWNEGFNGWHDGWDWVGDVPWSHYSSSIKKVTIEDGNDCLTKVDVEFK